ncbi:MAG: hypothetical protein MJ078_01300 [Clostridia bacterium]|nr:hypothetical protein [Clostridia bacterium]
MLKTALRNTKKYVRFLVGKENVRTGRFFTKSTLAKQMASLFTLPVGRELHLLGPGAGPGILSAALTESLCQRGFSGTVFLTAYENNAEMLPYLEKTLKSIRKICRKQYGVTFSYTIRPDNFVLALGDSFPPSLFYTEPEKYDMVIVSAPRDRLVKGAPEIRCADGLCNGAKDIAPLFALMSVFSLGENGQCVGVFPGSFGASPDLEKVRQYVAGQAYLTALCPLSGRKRPGKDKKESDKDLLCAFRAGKKPERFSVLTLREDKDELVPLLSLPYERVAPANGKPYLVLRSEAEAEALKTVESQPETLVSLGLAVKTGLVLESKYTEFVFDKQAEDTVPLFRPAQIKSGYIRMPVSAYIRPVIPSLAKSNRNMLFIRRVPAKRSRRLVTAGVYLASQCPYASRISTQNKLLTVDSRGDKEMDFALLHGLYAVLTSDLYDTYFRAVCKAPSLSVSLLQNLPLPSADVLRQIGKDLTWGRVMTPEVCTVLVNRVLAIKTH